MRITRFGAATLAASLTFGGAALAFADEVMPEDPTVEDVVETTTTTMSVVVEETTTTTVKVPDAAEEVEEPKDDGEAAGEDKVKKPHPDNYGKLVSEARHAGLPKPPKPPKPARDPAP